MGGILNEAITRLKDQKLDWAIANFADRPLWSTPYFLAAIGLAAASRRARYQRWHASRGQVRDGSRKVSVLMTTYNTGPYVTKAVQSILAQSYSNIELIVVDDASTDGTFGILQDIEAAESRMSVWRLSRNSGTYFAKNVARLIARGELFATHDSDDTCHPDWLRTHVSAHESFPEIVASQSHYVRVDEAGRTVLNRGAVSRPALASMVYSHRAVARTVGFFDSVRMAADREFLDRIVRSVGKDRIMRFGDRHYFALVRDGQLTAESRVSLTSKSRDEAVFMSPDRMDYIRAAEAWYGTRHPNDLRMPFPLKGRHFPAPGRFHPHRDAAGAVEYPGAAVVASGARGSGTVAELAASYEREFLGD